MNDEIFIALGSNIGDREAHLLKAIAVIGKLHDTRVTAIAPFYDTEPVGDISQENFLNTVLRISSSIPPQQLLPTLLHIETSVFERTRTIHWGPRTIDLDLLFYGNKVINSPPDLVLPHPRFHERRFVLAPLADIAPEFIHPIYGRSIRDLLENLPQGSNVTRI